MKPWPSKGQKEAALEKKQQIKQVVNDLAVINSGLQMTDKCIEHLTAIY